MRMTEKKLKANRQNALKHGLYPCAHILDSYHLRENREEKSWVPPKNDEANPNSV